MILIEDIQLGPVPASFVQFSAFNPIDIQIFQIYKIISPISDKTGGLLAVAKGGRFLCACFMALSS